jgi:hypothetical protein
MKNIFIILFIVFLGQQGYSQCVYYGYPSDTMPLRKMDVVILNIPTFSLNGGNRFVKMEEIDDLVQLLEINDTNTLRIEINYFYLSFLNERVTTALCENLKEILEEKTILKNYYLISNGSKNPIFDRKEDSEKYRLLNTRMEIIVE